MVTVFFSPASAVFIKSFTSASAAPIVYSLPPIVTFLPASRAPAATLKVAVVAPSVSSPLRPASWPFMYTSLVAPSASPFKRYDSLNLVVSATRSISVVSWSISDWIASRSVCELVPLEAWTASSFILWSIEWTSVSAPSAVCTADTPSSALVEAWSRPLICFLIFSEIERPAASSAARLIL